MRGPCIEKQIGHRLDRFTRTVARRARVLRARGRVSQDLSGVLQKSINIVNVYYLVLYQHVINRTA